MAKKSKRIRQTRTEFQKVFDKHPGMYEMVPWPIYIPEVMHISMALAENEYTKVMEGFHTVADYVNGRHSFQRPFHFNLSHTIELIKTDPTVLEKIKETSFKRPFDILWHIYRKILNQKIETPRPDNIDALFKGYEQILDGRSDTSILCKYLMLQYDQKNKDYFNQFGAKTKEEILDPGKKSIIMSMFLAGMTTSSNTIANNNTTQGPALSKTSE